MKENKLTRRKFITSTSATAAATMLSAPLFARSGAGVSSELALKGGNSVRTAEWLSWPVWNQEAESNMMELLRSTNWYRGDGNKCRTFEKSYAELIGAKRVIATSSGTTALITALHTLGVDAGDEVIVSPFTFIATYNVVFNQK
ncbi:MAG: aminotransferase class I/II-fold pyridoxal phosphate-dependent enzyme, partial [Bacteroidales bacterium]|nr:aminotransferase class I/II-fold pyridoxal phosphate-dependent enzyme [Bacteroidales bacterium]